MNFASYITSETKTAISLPLTCPPPYGIKGFGHKRKAFTLAETLITLTIIGVIAALTIPPLIKNYDSVKLRTQFLVAHEYITNATTDFSINDIDTRSISTTEIVNLINGATNIRTSNIVNIYKNYDGSMTSKGATANTLDIKFKLPKNMDGFLLKQYGGDHIIGVDINGESKKPNRYGHDVFAWGQNKITKKFELFSSIATNRDFNEYANHCYVKKNISWVSAEDGLGCGTYALKDPKYFRNLPK